jgi:hypothetical protein
MKIFLCFTFISFLKLIVPAQNNSLIDWNAELIDWNADKKLSWSDFKAPIDQSSPNAALTSTIMKYDMSYNSNDGLTFHIHCQFDKNTSWVRVKTDYILSHEQGHFDIAEIYARKFNKALKEYKPTSEIKKDINKIYQQTIHEFHDRQVQYDKETNFSINKPEQEEWLKKISSELKELAAYANYN